MTAQSDNMHIDCC